MFERNYIRLHTVNSVEPLAINKLMILCGFPYKIKNLFSAKDAISNLSQSRVVNKFYCASCSACYASETNRHLATCVREQFRSDKN